MTERHFLAGLVFRVLRPEDARSTEVDDRLLSLAFRMTFTAHISGAHKLGDKSNIARPSLTASAGRDLVPKSHTCPSFVRIAVQGGKCTRKPAQFLDSSTHPQDQGRHL